MEHPPSPPTPPATPPRIEHHEQLDSTSLHARRLIATGRSSAEAGPLFIRADRQTGGVGRLGRAWSSPPGGLWITGVFPVPNAGVGDFAGLGLRVGVAVLETIRAVCHGSGCAEHVRLKWPNDLLIGDRKVAGILTEVLPARPPLTLPASWVLVGVGVNANLAAADLPADLRRPATTLREQLGRDVPLQTFTTSLCLSLTAAVRPGDADAATLFAAEQALYARGRTVTLRPPGSPDTPALLTGLSDRGLPLLLTDADNTPQPLPPGGEILWPVPSDAS